MENKSTDQDTVETIMGEFIDRCDEYLICLTFAAKGVYAEGKKLKTHGVTKGQQFWIASDTASPNPKFHARMDASEFIKKSKKDGHFSNELSKALLCLIYSMWDEIYRHRVAASANADAANIISPLMGDLRKIRHCILHNKSNIPEKGIEFEVLTWPRTPGKLNITADMFLELNDIIRRNINISAYRLNPEVEKIYQQMTAKEKKSFDAWYKIPGNKQNNIPWPDLNKVITRINEGVKP
ncbi:hypothetical protein [Burkholderia stagnalis]|uniref:hypothetical protein n=1 Tax=Burkholderia stagnalis TaxID=1503054 RepID=UPI000A3EDB46|nr:hypothetical protein [Burkholderia stagnalis]